jgi:hypothetical protein
MKNMEKEKLESLIIDYIDDRLDPSERQIVERELTSNADSYKLYAELKEVMDVMERAAKLEPSAGLRHSFDQMLGREIKAVKKTKIVFFNPALYRVAAAVALLVLGGSIGFWISKHNAQEERLLAIENEMRQTKLKMMAMLENEQSPSQRIMGVNVAVGIDKADKEIVNALLKAMNEDPNSNVRLAALEALSNFSDDVLVKRELVASLAKQTDPIVQIALIQLMVKMREKSVVKDLQRIIDDSGSMKAVKDEAYSGILKLS